MKRAIVAVLLLLVGAAVVLAVVSTPYDPPPFTREEISIRVDNLNERAAVVVPHKSLDDGKARGEHLALFEKVEAGTPLTEEESAEYRLIYQSILKANQWYLGLFDGNLTVLTDVEMQKSNNVGGLGIQGAHDHHDVSARSNFADLDAALAAIRSASGPFGSVTRIWNATIAYKDLTDILLHLATAPQTKSVVYVVAGNANDAPLAGDFEAHLLLFKEAQFSPVNSPAHVAKFHAALDKYDGLVEAVQTTIFEHLSPWERTIAGRWGAWQSFGSSYDETVVSRFPRNPQLAAKP